MAHSTRNTRKELALADLTKQDKPSYMATAKKYGVVRTTLRARFLSQSLSIPAAASKYRRRLTLIKHINSLTDLGIPPTSRFVRNLADEMIRGLVEKDWTSDYVKRYQDRLKSLHLRNVDSQRVRAEYAPSFRLSMIW